MKCLVCGKDFVIKRGFNDILRTKKEFVCDKCYKDNPIEIEFNYIPLKNHQLEIVSLFKTSYVNHDAFINEICCKDSTFFLKIHLSQHFFR